MKKSAEDADNPPSRHPHTYSKQDWCDGCYAGEGGVTVERMDMMAEGGRGDNNYWRVMSDNCNSA